MTHTYELQKLEDDGSVTPVLKLNAEPKYAKQRAKDYANRHPGMYILQKTETVKMYFAKKE